MDFDSITMYKACLLHSRSERALKGLIARHLDEWGITRMEWLLLATAAEPSKHEEGHTMSEIAEVLDIRLSQLTALATDMNKEGLLTQTISSKDRRTKYVKITTRGIKFLDTVELSMRAAMKEWLSDVPIENLAIYLQTVYDLGANDRTRR